ncbi:hypothetical protein GCM10022222_30580 [Amycolatopsis ultiminotia]|uniref:Uncharacterized protein n=1 Tax=Amycolatopsis ultiminotia TaxID=543629 RepID=A0ABP6W4M8_9PSEU
MDAEWLTDTRTSYDTVAAGYAEQVRGAIDSERHLRTVLALFAEDVQADGGGPVVDVGCGPGTSPRIWRSSGSTRSGSTSPPG